MRLKAANKKAASNSGEGGDTGASEFIGDLLSSQGHTLGSVITDIRWSTKIPLTKTNPASVCGDAVAWRAYAGQTK